MAGGLFYANDDVNFTQDYAIDPVDGTRYDDLNEARRKGKFASGMWSNTPKMNQVDKQNPSQSVGERIADRRMNHTYGGDPNARAERVAMADAAMGRWDDRFKTETMIGYAEANAARNRQGFVDVPSLTGASTAAGEMRHQGQNLGNVGNQFLQFANQGPGPSAAQAQLNMATSAGVGDQLALARSGRGMGESAAAMRAAQGNIATLQGNAANQSAMLRAQEESDWRGQQLQAMGGAGNAYGAASNAYGASGGLNLAAGQYFTDANMRNRAQNDQTALAYNQHALEAQKVSAATEHAFQQQAHAVNMGALSGLMGYEAAQNDILGINEGVGMAGAARAQQEKAGWLSAGGAVLGTTIGAFAGGPGGAAAGGAAGGAVGRAASDIRAKENIQPTNARSAFKELGRYAGDGYHLDGAEGIYRPVRNETTELSAADESAFRQWAERNQIRDVDHPDSNYDYRGFWKENPDASVARGDHFPDTFKQHGHETFSVESRYSRGPDDGGRWDGEHFTPQGAVDVAGQRVQKRDVDFAALDGAADALKRAPAYEYDYKDPKAVGAEDKRYTGPMAQDLARTPAGRSAVTRMPDGKLGVDTGRLALLNSSATGEQSRQIDELSREIDSLRAMLGQQAPAARASRMGGSAYGASR